MGPDPDDQGSIREVSLSQFFIDRTEVTVAAYSECVDAGPCQPPVNGSGFNSGVPELLEHPVNGVSWFDANTYCLWVSGGAKRLPTEAEWERAARGKGGLTYTWGEIPEPSCEWVAMSENGVGCGTGGTLPVGSRIGDISPWGAVDMAGNVAEWVNDWYGPYDMADDEDPRGPATGTERVIRGGSIINVDFDAFRTMTRSKVIPEAESMDIGFRCVSDEPIE